MKRRIEIINCDRKGNIIDFTEQDQNMQVHLAIQKLIAETEKRR